MIKQSQVKPVRPVKMAAAVLITGAAVTVAACSSGTSGSSASKAAAPHKTGQAASPSMHSGSHMPTSHMATAASPTATGASPTAKTGSPMASKATCKHVRELRMSLQNLNHLSLTAGSASKIRTDLTNIQTHVTAIKSQGGNSALTAQMDQLSASVDKVRAAAHGLATPPTTAQVNGIVTALTQLKAQSKSAAASMNAACPK